MVGVHTRLSALSLRLNGPVQEIEENIQRQMNSPGFRRFPCTVQAVTLPSHTCYGSSISRALVCGYGVVDRSLRLRLSQVVDTRKNLYAGCRVEGGTAKPRCCRALVLGACSPLVLVLLVLLGSWTGPSIQQVVLQLDSPTVSWTSNGGIRVLWSISTSTR